MELVGKRVSVRFRDGTDVRDVVGHVLVADDVGLTIRRRTGEVAVVPKGTVLAMNIVPEAPPRRKCRPD